MQWRQGHVQQPAFQQTRIGQAGPTDRKDSPTWQGMQQWKAMSCSQAISHSLLVSIKLSPQTRARKRNPHQQPAPRQQRLGETNAEQITRKQCCNVPQPAPLQPLAPAWLLLDQKQLWWLQRMSPAAQSIEAAFRPDTKLATRDAEEKASHK